MKNLTIRKIESDLHQALKKEAHRQGLGINHYIMLILQEAVDIGDGLSIQAVEFHDLDHLAGTWTEEEYSQFENELKFQRRADEILWR